MTSSRKRSIVTILSAMVMIGLCSCGGVSGAQPKASSPSKALISLQAPSAYTPSAPSGGTDDYHCTLLNPHLTQNSMIVESQFYPGSYEVHHAIFYLVPPSTVAAAEQENQGGKGWTCFGESDIGAFGSTPWLAFWAPGLGATPAPTGTGVSFPIGTMVVMQIHYNLLLGDKPVTPKLVLTTVPANNTTLDPLQLNLLLAPIDAPCPAGSTGPLCSRSAELQSVGQRFGQSQERFAEGLEIACGRNPVSPPIGPTTTCTMPVTQSEYLLRLTAHMHLMGQGMQIVLNPGTAGAKTLLNVTNYDFHFQRYYDLAAPVHLMPGDNLQISCTYDTQRELTDPVLDQLPPHFVTWGDGSSDEMCLGVLQYVSTLTPQVKA